MLLDHQRPVLEHFTYFLERGAAHGPEVRCDLLPQVVFKPPFVVSGSQVNKQACCRQHGLLPRLQPFFKMGLVLASIGALLRCNISQGVDVIPHGLQESKDGFARADLLQGALVLQR